MKDTIRVSWISDFAIEWLADLPEELRYLPRNHPMTWQAVLLNELRANSSLQLDIVVLRKNIPRDYSFSRDGINFHMIKTQGGTRAPSMFWTDTLLLKKKLARTQPHVVHAWGAERGAGLVASRLKYPYLVTIQGLLSWYMELVPVPMLDRFSAFWERITLRRAALATTESTFVVNYLKKRFPRLDVRQIEHAPNWHFHQVERCPQIRPIRLIFVGSFDYRKGADLLLYALDRLRNEIDFELMVLGFAPPELKEQLAASVAPETWKRIQFRQGLTPKEVAVELAKATLMVFPTRADTGPTAVKEAAVAGVPVVGSRIGGIPDYVFPGRNGLMFESEYQDGLLQAIRAACCHPLFGQGKVEPDALAQVRSYLSPKLMAEKFFGVYHDLAAKRL